MSVVNMILLILISSVMLTNEACVGRRCPLGQFYNGTTDSCVSSCFPNYGNWTTGRCVEGSAKMRGWLDSDMYEVLIPSSVQLVNCNRDCIINDISFHLQSSYPYFYLASEKPIPLNFLDNANMFVSIMTESVDLLSAVNGHIPLNDYKMRIEVAAGEISLLRSDIIIHVIESLPSLPSLPVPVTCVGFDESKYSVLESDGLLTVTLVLTGESQSTPFNVIVIANVTNGTPPSATAEDDFISGQYNVTFSSFAIQATVNITLQIDDIDEETEYFILHLYIPSGTYKLGIQQGDIIKAEAIIIRPAISTRLALIYHGRVEVYYNGEWGTVCDDGWDNTDATVVCRQLGFHSTARAYGSAHYGQGTGPIWLSKLSCIGNESNLFECGQFDVGTKNCTHSDDASVYCGYYDYRDRTRRLPIRLKNGTNEKEGRVEIYWNNQWCTVCDDLWDDNDATVFCKQLGYSRGSARVSAYFGEGSGFILLDNVNCDGTESTLFACRHRNFGEHDCTHNEDAGVVCYGELSTVRLVGGSSHNEGRVEVYYNGRWGTVCTDGWDEKDANVVCRQLGFESSETANFGLAAKDQILLENVMCSSSNTILANCGHYGVGIRVGCNYNNYYKVAGVKCYDTVVSKNVIQTKSSFYHVTVSPHQTSDLTRHPSPSPVQTNGFTLPVPVIDKVPIRLAGRHSHHYGRVEVYYNGEWGTVCDDGWDTADATVVCRQLGYYSSVTAYRSAHYGQGTGPIWLSRLFCFGNESNLTDCNQLSVGTKNCTHSDDASVVCNGLRRLPIRLANGRNEKEGRVEIYWNNQWSTVCDDLWNDNDATVICKQLGYSRGSARVSAYFGKGSGLILLDNVNCNGRESSIFDCNHRNFGEHDCEHTEDAGVVCYGESSKGL